MTKETVVVNLHVMNIYIIPDYCPELSPRPLIHQSHNSPLDPIIGLVQGQNH